MSSLQYFVIAAPADRAWMNEWTIKWAMLTLRANTELYQVLFWALYVEWFDPHDPQGDKYCQWSHFADGETEAQGPV